MFDSDADRFYKWDGQYVCASCFVAMRQAHRMTIRDYINQRNLATPRWCDRQKIEAIYNKAREMSALTGIPHHVDHEIPLRSKKVSGLHVPWNLRVIPAVDNLRKGNRLE